MALDMTRLNQSQQLMANKIIDAGRKLGVPDVLLQAALNIANAESSFNPSAGATTTTAKGMFQYIDATWQSAWNNYSKSNPSSPLVNLSNPRSDADAQIAVM